MNPHLPYALNNFLLVRVYPGYLAGADQTWRDHEPAVLQHLKRYQEYKAQCARDHDEKALWLFRSQTEYGFSHNHLRKHCMREVILAQNCQSSLFRTKDIIKVMVEHGFNHKIYVVLCAHRVRALFASADCSAAQVTRHKHR